MAKKTMVSKKAAALTKMKTEIANNFTHLHNSSAAIVEMVNPNLVQEMLDEAKSMLAEWERTTKANMTLLERKRTIGPGNSNYGFIEQVSDLAMENPDYAKYISVTDLKSAIINVEACRNLSGAFQSLVRAVTNTMLTYSTIAYELARDYYKQVKLRADQGDATAIELYRMLKTRFKMPKRAGLQKTNKQIERDVHNILTHKKDGEVIVSGSSPKIIKGKTEVIDNVRKGRAQIKGKFDEQIEN